MPPRGSVGTGARHPPLPSYVEGEGARARWEGTGGRLTAHAGPAHPPESPHVRSGPTSRGRESEEEAERAGLALPLAAEVCSRLLVPSELEARAAGAGARAQWAGGGGARTLDPGGQRAWRGQGAGEGAGALLSVPFGLFGPRRELGKSFRVDCCGDPPPCRPPAPRHPRPSPLASRSVPARPPPPGRARAARSRLHQPGPGRPRVPGAAAARAGSPGRRAAPLPRAGRPGEGDLSR